MWVCFIVFKGAIRLHLHGNDGIYVYMVSYTHRSDAWRHQCDVISCDVSVTLTVTVTIYHNC